MIHANHVEAVQFVRKLRGGSQPILVEASDGYFYVVKYLNNLQGPNLLFNEAIGSALFHAAGLPVPAWRVVHLSEKFVAQNPGCWMETETGRSKPNAGMCFGSRFMDLSELRVFEILSGEHFSRVRNRRNFWAAWVLDVLSDHTDNRQALFLEGSTKWLDACFIDHGHMFGGANGRISPYFAASRYIDLRIYAQANAEEVEELQGKIQGIDLVSLARIAKRLPVAWRTVSAVSQFEGFHRRFTDRKLLQDTTKFILGSAEHAKKDHDRISTYRKIGFESPHLCAQILPGADGRDAGEGRNLVCGERRRGPQPVRPEWLEAAGF